MTCTTSLRPPPSPTTAPSTDFTVTSLPPASTAWSTLGSTPRPAASYLVSRPATRPCDLRRSRARRAQCPGTIRPIGALFHACPRCCDDVEQAESRGLLADRRRFRLPLGRHRFDLAFDVEGGDD